jgi:hypothetical protein
VGGEDFQFEPHTLIAPLYHKVRLNMETMLKALVALNLWFASALKLAAQTQLMTLKEIVWDIELADNARYKAEVRADASLQKTTRSDLLSRDLPRYIWRVRASSQAEPIFDLLFDATDLLQGSQMTGVAYRSDICAVFGSLATTSRFQDRVARTGANRHVQKALEWLTNHLDKFHSAAENSTKSGSHPTPVLPAVSPVAAPQ